MENELTEDVKRLRSMNYHEMNLIAILPEVRPGDEKGIVLAHCDIINAETGESLPAQSVTVNLPFGENGAMGVATADVRILLSGFRTKSEKEFSTWKTVDTDGECRRRGK